MSLASRQTCTGELFRAIAETCLNRVRDVQELENITELLSI